MNNASPMAKGTAMIIASSDDRAVPKSSLAA